MKITCYCIGCKRHPLHDKRDNFVWIKDGPRPVDKKEKESGVKVDCFEPSSDFYSETGIEKDEYQFESCMYGGWSTQAVSEQIGFTIFAHCENEDDGE